MATTELPLVAERMASLARASLELPPAGDAAGPDALCGEMLAGLSSKGRAELLREVEPLLASEGPAATEPAGGSEAAPAGGARELLRERAAILELSSDGGGARYAVLEVAFSVSVTGHAEALQSLALQQKPFSELQGHGGTSIVEQWASPRRGCAGRSTRPSRCSSSWTSLRSCAVRSARK